MLKNILIAHCSNHNQWTTMRRQTTRIVVAHLYMFNLITESRILDENIPIRMIKRLGRVLKTQIFMPNFAATILTSKKLDSPELVTRFKICFNNIRLWSVVICGRLKGGKSGEADNAGLFLGCTFVPLASTFHKITSTDYNHFGREMSGFFWPQC